MKTLSKLSTKAILGAGIFSLAFLSAHADSLWRAEYSVGLIADKKATAVGDIVTVVVQENNSTKKDASTQTEKKTGLDAKLEAFLYSPGASKFLTKGGQLPQFGMSSDNSFNGGGKIDNSETIAARFGVRVVDVLPNGNLLVEGLRQTSFSGESSTVILRGTVRPYDITSANTVFSYNLADVSIKFDSSGALSNTQNKGWFSKAWDVLTPF